MTAESPIKILIIEDDREISELLSEGLGHRGFETMALTSGESLFSGTVGFAPDLILLDIMLPGEDGLSICRKLRMRNSGFELTPIIIVSALGELTDRVVGLELGADDYLPKPFAMHELTARIRAVLRRSLRQVADAPNEPSGAASIRRIWKFGSWRIDMDARMLIDESGASSALTAMEFKLLKCFLENPYRVLERSRLLERIGSRSEYYDRSLDVQISRLRSRLGDSGKNASLIRTMRGDGYMLAVDVEKT